MAAPHTPGSTATKPAGGQAGVSASAQGGEDLRYTGGGARQLRILDAEGHSKSVADLLDLGILQGMEVPVGLR